MTEHKEICETCRYYRPGHEPYEPEMTIKAVREEENETGNSCGYCRRYPPVASIVEVEREDIGSANEWWSHQPEVYLSDWCGEWKPREVRP